MIGSLLVAACGSTAPRQAPEAIGSDDLGNPPVTGGTADATDSGIDDGTNTGRARGDPTRSSEAPGAPSAQAGGTRADTPSESPATRAGVGVAGAVGRGITEGTIRIGIGWMDFRDVVGLYVPERAGDDRTGAARAEPEAVVRWMNEHGGIAGRIGAVLSTVAMLGAVVTAANIVVLGTWLAVAGCGLAFAQPAANRRLVSVVAQGRLGLSFGIKQSSPPLSSMLAGAVVPTVAVTVGWRWSFAVASALAVGVLIWRGLRSERQGPRSRTAGHT